MCISQPRRSGSFCSASAATLFMLAEIASAISSSSTLRLELRRPSRPDFMSATDCTIVLGSSSSESGIPARRLAALRIVAAGERRRLEFLPVTIEPSGSCTAAAQQMPPKPLPAAAPAAAASRAGTTTGRSVSFRPAAAMIERRRSTVASVTRPRARSEPPLRKRRTISWREASWTRSSSAIAKPTLLTPMSVGER